MQHLAALVIPRHFRRARVTFELAASLLCGLPSDEIRAYAAMRWIGREAVRTASGDGESTGRLSREGLCPACAHRQRGLVLRQRPLEALFIDKLLFVLR